MSKSDKKILITGFPRSGTGSIAQFCTKNGFFVGHEYMRENGISSWFDTFEGGKFSWRPDKTKDYRRDVDKIIHLIRFPLDVISSSSTLLPESFAYMYKVLGRTAPKIISIKDVVRLWIDWNERIESFAHDRIKIEDMSNFTSAKQFFSNTFNVYSFPYNLWDCPKSYNKRDHGYLNWRQFRHECGIDLYSEFCSKVKEYGYELPKKQKVTLCFMGKNEASNIERMLKSAEEVSLGNSLFYDSLLYMDTGSDDNSIEVAKRYDATVIEKKWNDHYSDMRNHLISHIKEGWFVMIDCDEVFKGDFSGLRDILYDTPYNVNCLRLQMRNIEGDKQNLVFNVGKIFRANHVKYRHRVHNLAVYDNYSPLFVDGYLEHFGYDITKDQMKKKLERTERLLKMRIEEKEVEEDYPPYFYLSQVYAQQERYDEALKSALTYKELAGEKPSFNRSVLLTICTLLAKFEKFAELEQLYSEVCSENKNDLDVYYHMVTYGVEKKLSRYIITGSERYLESFERFNNNPSMMNSFFYHHLQDKDAVFILAVNACEHLRIGSQRIHSLRNIENPDSDIAKFQENSEIEMERIGIEIKDPYSLNKAS
jgi:hypothetical protein